MIFYTVSAPAQQEHKDTWSLSRTCLKIFCSSLSSPGPLHSSTAPRLSSLSQKCVSVPPCGSHHFDPITLGCIDKKHQQELASNSVTCDMNCYLLHCVQQAALLCCSSFWWRSRTSFINRTTKFLFSGLSLWSERKLALDMSKISSIMAAKLPFTFSVLKISDKWQAWLMLTSFALLVFISSVTKFSTYEPLRLHCASQKCRHILREF